MNTANVPLYIRFGDIPGDGISHVHFSDYDARPEGGLSVYEAIEANGRYYPLLQKDANEDGVADYFDFLLDSKRPVYLLTGSRIRLEGAGREPLLQSWRVIKEISYYYGRDCREAYDKRRSENKLKDVRFMQGDIYGNNMEKEIDNMKTGEEKSRKIICLCGSMKFFQEMLNKATQLTLEGNVVLTPFKDYRNKDEIPQSDLDTLGKVHQSRIEMCDEVLVVNPGKYIGESVEKEIAYAKSLGKPISYTDHPDKPYIVTLCGSRKFQCEFSYQFEKLTKEGKIVLTPAIFEMSSPDQLTTITHATLDFIHQQKMAMSDEVMIINKGGYIGEDTQKEIDWCLSHNIKVTYLEPVEEKDK